MNTRQWQHRRWDAIPAEKMKGAITRRIVTGERVMLGLVTLQKDDVVPRHAHDNEQVTHVLSGALRFRLGADGEDDVTVRAGEVLVIPANLPHSAVALEDTVEVDVFTPPREDWLNQTDDYLRNG